MKADFTLRVYARKGNEGNTVTFNDRVEATADCLFDKQWGPKEYSPEKEAFKEMLKVRRIDLARKTTAETYKDSAEQR